MKATEIREKFVEFFNSKGHQKISSSSLVPHNDDTLLFANAGMNQFKDIFTGKQTPESKRTVTIQKCVRAGGKHNDLENVGFTARHHTFFEMLGNFSFGDYFKKEAIEYAWEFLTEVLKIDKEKLYVTVHYTDKEAREIWNKHIGLDQERIRDKGDKDNFWEMGEVGPCGPCSEIFYDHGDKFTTPNFKPGKDQDFLDDEQRYIEIWNLVFMQYEKKKVDGKIEKVELPKPSIDTGAGLERIAAAMQGSYWNYDTDLFSPIINKITELSKVEGSIESKRVIADHVRSTTMLITDGVLPSNEGRGYVLRRIIRRAVRHLRELNVEFPFMDKLIPSVFEILGQEYPQNLANIDLAIKIIKGEEEKFLETIDNGLKFFNQSLKNDLQNETLPGASIFKLYDTYGFPVDLTEVLLREKNLKADITGFEELMEKRKEESKKSWKAGASVDNQVYYQSKEKSGNTTFTGYDHIKTQSKLLDVIELNENYDGLIFDQTPFYAESGGQMGDTGSILLDGNTVEITDTQKPIDDFFVHFVKKNHGLKVGESYNLEVDSKDRQLTMRNHSATHLLQAALIEVLGNHIKQAGSNVGPDKLRFDFTHPKGLSKDELKKVQDLVNEKIASSLEVTASKMTMNQALEKGAMALFGEKYGDEVRVLEMGDFSLELCGGTHVTNTAHIGSFIITSESSLSSGVRRIEALTSSTANQFLEERSTTLYKIEQSFNAKSDELVEKLEKLNSDLKKAKKEITQLKQQVATGGTAKERFTESVDHGDFKVFFEEVSSEVDLRQYSDEFVSKYPKDLLLLASEKGGKRAVLLRTQKANKNINCKELIGSVLTKFNGRGGGKPDMAQGSCDLVDLKELIGALTNS
ncbi:MAG: alanine--tRNA ligase [Bacteriovoracaceae bacterium]